VNTQTEKALDVEALLNGRCVYCGKPAQGNYSIHRDGYGIGPEVPLCDECGQGPVPTCEHIWERTSEEKE
jgi:NAD-dependent SIR2 family protein deacetylase